MPRFIVTVKPFSVEAKDAQEAKMEFWNWIDDNIYEAAVIVEEEKE